MNLELLIADGKTTSLSVLTERTTSASEVSNQSHGNRPNKARRKGRGLFSFGGIFGGKRPFTTLNLHSMQLLGVSRSLLFVSSSVHSVEERDGLQVDLRLSRRPTTNRNPAKLPCPNEVPHEIVCEALS
eukprot:gene7642-8445_t